MKETVFHGELASAFRKVGCWIYKIPDLPINRDSQLGEGGKLRFNLPKPCDLVGARPPLGQFLAIEAKLLRARTFRVDARLLKQLETLGQLAGRGAWTALALNFRFEAKRPQPAVINRAFLLRRLDLGLAEHDTVTLQDVEVLALELPRVTGGWTLPANLWTQEA